jgi:hypothetical protein
VFRAAPAATVPRGACRNRSARRMSETGELQRDLGFLGALTIGTGTMIDAGIFLLAGVALEQTGPARSCRTSSPARSVC